MPLSDVHVNPERLGAIAEELSNFSSDVHAVLSSLDAELARLGRSWQDDEYTKFKRAIQPMRRVLDQFQQEITRSKPDMLADAEAIRAYQKLRTP